MLIEMTVQDFTAEVASSTPAPGGGSVAALAGAQAAALLAMYCNLTVGREKYAAAESLMRETLAAVEKHRLALLAAVDDDTLAFEKVMAAYKLPRSSPEEKADRQAAIGEAFKEAARVPLSVCRHCVEILSLLERATGTGNESAVTDFGVANLQAFAGLTGASYNVLINLAAVKDAGFVAECTGKLADLRSRGGTSYEKILAYLEQQLKL
jgi:formiminotetrahydrofolate cyclodeaminase